MLLRYTTLNDDGHNVVWGRATRHTHSNPTWTKNQSDGTGERYSEKGVYECDETRKVAETTSIAGTV